MAGSEGTLAREILDGLRMSVLDLEKLSEYEEAVEDAESIITRHLEAQAEREDELVGALESLIEDFYLAAETSPLDISTSVGLSKALRALDPKGES